MGCKAITQALQAHALAPRDVDAIVITHEHIDHVAALPIWCKSTPTTVYAPQAICSYLRQKVVLSEVVEITSSFTVGDVCVDYYECSHDARACFGYKFSVGNASFASVTDTGIVTDKLVEFLSPCQAVMVESNHDVDMLVSGPYSYVLKQRILSNYGHLSNAQCGEILCKIAPKGVKNIILAHLSETNNTKELAFNAAVNAFASCGITEGKQVNVFVADQHHNEVTICLD